MATLPMATQTELVREIADTLNHSQNDVREVLAALEDFIQEEIQSGNRVRVCGIQIEPRVKAATKKRKGRNPATGEEVMIKAKPATVKLKLRAVAPLSKVKLPSVKRLEAKF
jgi:nucleoid DNA-binding protein